MNPKKAAMHDKLVEIINLSNELIAHAQNCAERAMEAHHSLIDGEEICTYTFSDAVTASRKAEGLSNTIDRYVKRIYVKACRSEKNPIGAK